MKLFLAAIFILCVFSVKVVGNNSPASSFAPFKKAGGKQEGRDGPMSLFGSKARNPEREQLYEAYNLLHTLAQVSASDSTRATSDVIRLVQVLNCTAY